MVYTNTISDKYYQFFWPENFNSYGIRNKYYKLSKTHQNLNLNLKFIIYTDNFL